jgi:sugar O-acyltransferase (sialic acid O-acetyltransferase NeuD family)
MEGIVQNKRNLYLIGASFFGREMESWLELIPKENREWEFVGYLHSSSGDSPLIGYPTDYNILGEWETYPLTKNDYCLITIADCHWKEKIYNVLKGKTTFFTYIAPNAIVGKFNLIGEGSIICPNCILTTNILLGRCTTLNIGTQIGHDAIIGDFSSLMANVDLGGHVTLGKSVFIGSKATIIPKIRVEDSSIIGAGSVVIKKVKTGTTVFGNPAKELKSNATE